MCYAWLLSLLQFSVLRHKKDVWQLGIAMMFQTSTSFQNIKTTFVQQPIVKLVLNHLDPKEEEKFVNANNTIEKTW